FVKSESDTLHLGTVGTDMFQNRVLIIDYPRNRFAICDSVPLRFSTSFVPFELDRLRRVILPMQVGGKTFRILFDNGSSMFPLITPRGNISRFSTEVETDSFRIRSWGQAHWVKGRTLKEPFRLAGQTFAGTTIYADGREYNLSAFDGIAGNALFWNKTLVIDFRNKRFGVK
ncbi:MAG TPA: hypothetical protein VM871_00045, partial [Flavisolibacter sp.]|nr:hypothetical protein [Flavisolibacter sp.]